MYVVFCSYFKIFFEAQFSNIHDYKQKFNFFVFKKVLSLYCLLIQSREIIIIVLCVNSVKGDNCIVCQFNQGKYYHCVSIQSREIIIIVLYVNSIKGDNSNYIVCQFNQGR